MRARRRPRSSAAGRSGCRCPLKRREPRQRMRRDQSRIRLAGSELRHDATPADDVLHADLRAGARARDLRYRRRLWGWRWGGLGYDEVASEPLRAGGGFMIDAHGLVVTAAHVVAGSKDIVVKL